MIMFLLSKVPAAGYKRASNWEMGPAMIKSRQILHSKHMLKFGTCTTFLLHRDLQQSENQIPSWILDIKKVSRLFLDTGDFGLHVYLSPPLMLPDV